MTSGPIVDRMGKRGVARSPFPAIADHGFLSDCETTALVAPGGALEWMCRPRMHSPFGRTGRSCTS